MESEDKAILDSIGEDMVMRVVKILELKNKRATGELIDSIDYIIGTDKSGNSSIKLLAEFYWVYVEYGRRPGTYPPPDAILDWMKAKGISAPPKIYKRVPKNPQSQEKRDRGLAFAISRSIWRRGIKALPFLEQAVSEVEKNWASELEGLWGEKWEAELFRIFKNNFRTKS